MPSLIQVVNACGAAANAHMISRHMQGGTSHGQNDSYFTDNGGTAKDALGCLQVVNSVLTVAQTLAYSKRTTAPNSNSITAGTQRLRRLQSNTNGRMVFAATDGTQVGTKPWPGNRPDDTCTWVVFVCQDSANRPRWFTTYPATTASLTGRNYVAPQPQVVQITSSSTSSWGSGTSFADVVKKNIK